MPNLRKLLAYLATEGTDEERADVAGVLSGWLDEHRERKAAHRPAWLAIEEHVHEIDAGLGTIEGFLSSAAGQALAMRRQLFALWKTAKDCGPAKGAAA